MSSKKPSGQKNQKYIKNSIVGKLGKTGDGCKAA
jgi:hypothetical protein